MSVISPRISTRLSVFNDILHMHGQCSTDQVFEDDYFVEHMHKSSLMLPLLLNEILLNCCDTLKVFQMGT